jgi:hypothetical protein
MNRLLLTDFAHAKELRLLILALYTHLNTIQLQELEVLHQTDLDWNYIYKVATFHEIQALVYRQVVRDWIKYVPPATFQEFQQYYQRNTYKNLLITSELYTLLALFEAKNIPTLIFKGVIMSEFLYHDSALRAMGDLDILIPQAEVVKARELLQTQHYLPTHHLNAAQFQHYIKTIHIDMFKHTDTKFMIDVHWRLLPAYFSFTPSDTFLWSNTIKLKLDGVELKTLRWESLLLYLCTHAAKHNWESFKSVCDIYKLLSEYPDLDWAWINANAGKLGTRRMLWLGLYIVYYISGIESIPTSILTQIEADYQLQQLGNAIVAAMFSDQNMGISDNSPTSPPPHSAYYVRLKHYLHIHYIDPLTHWLNYDHVFRQTMERKRDIFWYWVNCAMQPSYYDLGLPLPSSLTLLYYPIRFGRSVIKLIMGKH